MSDNNTRLQERPQPFLEVFAKLGVVIFLTIAVSLFIFLTFSVIFFIFKGLNDEEVMTPIKVAAESKNVDETATGGEDIQPRLPEPIPPDRFPGRWVQPLPGNLYLTQGRHGRRSDAVDLYAEIGTPVFAARAGRIIVSETGYNYGHGNYIIIDHGDGVESVYCHLSVLYVEYGQVVAQGQTIGLSGNTGRVYSSHGGNGAHLHFAVRGGGVENPLFNLP